MEMPSTFFSLSQLRGWRKLAVIGLGVKTIFFRSKS